MIFSSLFLLAAMSSSEAIVTMLNSESSVSPRKFQEAREIVMKDAYEGKALQRFLVGVMNPDKPYAKEYMRSTREKIKELAEKKKNSLALYLLSLENNDLRLLRKAADGGNVQAMNAFGTITTQEALSRNLATNALETVLTNSFNYFRKAAAARDPNGFINLGTCYFRGFGCERDLALAFECYRSAAELGHPEGMDNMSACYQFGHGVKPDQKLSLFWAMKAKAARGDEGAADWLKERR